MSSVTVPRPSDSNLDLYFSWRAVKDHHTLLLRHLEEHKQLHDTNGYYGDIRSEHNKFIALSAKWRRPVKVAASTIYLNKTGYNGLYRVNRKGEFNVPRGDYKSPKIFDPINISACSEVLRRYGVKISSCSFEEISPRKNHFVYADPPYDETFTGYQAECFGKREQEKLRDKALEWHEADAYVMISNSSTKDIRRLYSGKTFNIQEVPATRMINSNAEGRGTVTELIIRNYRK